MAVMKEKTRLLVEKLSDRESVLTEQDIRGLLNLSSLEKINIFMNHNRIIKRLCVELLKAWGHDPWRAKR